MKTYKSYNQDQLSRILQKWEECFRPDHITFKSYSLMFYSLARKPVLVRFGHVSLDGTKIKANASKHKAMSYERMQTKRND